MAIEFAKAKPACIAFTNRGSGAHYNGFNNDRAVILLNAIVGSIGKPGGYCYTFEPTRVPPTVFPQPNPQPPAPKVKSVIEDPPEWPLANKWQRMKVGQIVYQYMKEGRGKVQVLLSYTVASPQTWPEGRSLTVDVLSDEKLLPFHACWPSKCSGLSPSSSAIHSPPPAAGTGPCWGTGSGTKSSMCACMTASPSPAPPAA